MGTTTLTDYRAVRETVGFLDLHERGKIKVTGPDRVTFLHSMISNDVQELPEWQGRYGTFLTARGKIVADFFYYRLPEFVLVDIQGDLLMKTVETLEKYIIMDDVGLEDVSEKNAHFSLQGPKSSDLLADLFKRHLPVSDYQVGKIGYRGTDIWVIRKNELSDTGFEIILPVGLQSTLKKEIVEAGSEMGLTEVSPESRNVLRLERGIPWYGVDMDEKRYPMEARLDEAISLTKGCYIGQEVVAKATHVGGVGNLLTGLKLKGNEVPAAGAPVKDAEGKQIGKVTSAVFSPRFECAVAFAYLKRAFARTGEVYDVEVDEGEVVSAEVVDDFSTLA